MARTRSNLIRQTTRGSVLDDLKVSGQMLDMFKVKAELHSRILEVASRYSQSELQAILHEPQPRISDFVRGKITKFSLETLLDYAARLNMHPQITTTWSKHREEAVAVG